MSPRLWAAPREPKSSSLSSPSLLSALQALHVHLDLPGPENKHPPSAERLGPNSGAFAAPEQGLGCPDTPHITTGTESLLQLLQFPAAASLFLPFLQVLPQRFFCCSKTLNPCPGGIRGGAPAALTGYPAGPAAPAAPGAPLSPPKPGFPGMPSSPLVPGTPCKAKKPLRPPKTQLWGG